MIERYLANQRPSGQPARSTPARERLAAVTSRAGKQAVRTAELDRSWLQDARDAGLDPAAIVRLQTARRSALAPVGRNKLVAALTEFDATFADCLALRGLEVRAAAAVHDIGKVRVPPDVLEKPGRLTSAKFELVKRHADVGAEIVACLGDPELTAIVRHHHERFDGTGTRRVLPSNGYRSGHGSSLSPIRSTR
jgi:HD domain-containing protein